MVGVLVPRCEDPLDWSAFDLSARPRKSRALRFRIAAIRSVALGAMLAFAVAEVVVCAQPAWADDDGGGGGHSEGGGNGAAASGGASAGGGHATTNPRKLLLGSAGRNWFAKSAARLTAPLSAFLRRTQRASSRAAADLAKAGESTVGAPLNWLAGRAKATPNDQDKAMAAVRRGEIVPLASVLKTVEKSVPGDVLNIALTKDVEGTWNYQITVLTPQGYYREVNVDAGHNNVTSVRPH